jgi:SulP family sulfate permease
MKRFLKETGVVRPSDKAVAFRQLDDALEWIESNTSSGPEIIQNEPILSLYQMPFLVGHHPESIMALEAIMETKTIKAGKKVFKAGGDGDELFLIRRGLVKVTLPIHKKDSYHLGTSGPGVVIGGLGFLNSSGHSTDGVALTDVEVYILHRSKFDQFAEQHRTLAFAILESVAHNLANRLYATVAELHALRG